MVPVTSNGSKVIYDRIVRPYFLKYEKKVDKGIADAKKLAAKVKEEGESVASQAGTAITKEAVSHMLSGEKSDKQD